MLQSDLTGGAGEWPPSGEPLVDDDAQGILIARGSRLACQLLGSHIGQCATDPLLDRERSRTVRHGDAAKVTEQDLLAGTHQHVLWLDIAVNQVHAVRVLQGGGKRSYIGNNSRLFTW